MFSNLYFVSIIHMQYSMYFTKQSLSGPSDYKGFIVSFVKSNKCFPKTAYFWTTLAIPNCRKYPEQRKISKVYVVFIDSQNML